MVGKESGKESWRRGKRMGRGEREWEEGKESGKRGKGVERGGRKMRSKIIEEEYCIGQIIFVLPI